MKSRLQIMIVLGAFAIAGLISAQQRGPRPPMRRHKATTLQPVVPIPANAVPPAKPEVSIKLADGKRHIHSNGMPAHKIGTYPTRHNPNAIGVQHYHVKLEGSPKPADQVTHVHDHTRRGPPNMVFGFAVNGIFFEPGTAEFWQGDRQLGWNYEALGGAVPLGIDENFGHVQPNGAYHYHGLPTGLLKELGVAAGKHSPLVGWASDGYPIYARFGYENGKNPTSKIVEFKSSYRLKKGTRVGGERGPGGKYDGTFTRDYEYVKGLSGLDECNGRFTVTPEFPKGTYAYFLTENWPVIPRAFRGKATDVKAATRPQHGPPRR